MADLSNAVQQAVFTALDASTELAALLAEHVDIVGSVGIYDDVPQTADTGDNSRFPYVTIGDDTLADWSTDTSSGAEATVTVHTWTRANGRKQAKDIQGAIYNALHRQELTTPDHTFIGCEFEFAESMMDPDGKTRHGVSRFRLTLDGT